MPRRARHAVQFVREERQPTLDELEWLVSPEGDEACLAMSTDAPADTPAAIARWRERLAPEHVSAAWAQVTLRQKAKAKFTHAGKMLFDRVGLEQATDDVVAAYKAKRFADCGSVVDFCCGVGGDALGIAQHADVTVLDWSEARTFMAKHNAGVYGHIVETAVGDAAFDHPRADAAHIDPDRRADGPRRHDPAEGSPDLDVLHRIVEKYKHVAIKLSPGASLDRLGIDGEYELISLGGDCKQLVVWTGKLKTIARRATLLPSGATLAVEADESLFWPASAIAKPGMFLHEPDSAVVRANLVGPLARREHLSPLDPRIAYLVGDHQSDSPLCKAFRVIDTAAWSVRTARRWLKGHDVGSLDIKTRGFAGSPEELIKSLRLQGSQKRVLMLTRVADKPLAILADRA